jgi:hypothetical protein
MKTILILLLIAISVICQGQNTINILSSKNWQAFDSTYQKSHPIIVSGGIIGERDIRTGGIYNPYCIDLNTPKVTIESNGKFTINLDGFKVTDTIWIQNGKKKVGIPAYKMLNLLGYKNEFMFLCPKCKDGFVYKRAELGDNHGIITQYYKCEKCNYRETHYYQEEPK